MGEQEATRRRILEAPRELTDDEDTWAGPGAVGRSAGLGPDVAAEHLWTMREGGLVLPLGAGNDRVREAWRLTDVGRRALGE